MLLFTDLAYPMRMRVMMERSMKERKMRKVR